MVKTQSVPTEGRRSTTSMIPTTSRAALSDRPLRICCIPINAQILCGTFHRPGARVDGDITH